MSNYASDDNYDDLSDKSSDGENTMAVLSTIGGGEDALAEGEPLGLDPNAGKAKLSGSSLAVGVVVVFGAVALLGMKMTLGAIAAGESPIEDIATVDQFMINLSSAKKVGAEGPIKAPDEESKQVLDELKQDPTDYQVPAEEVETNPFDLSGIVTRTTTETGPDEPGVDPRAVAIERAKAAAAQLKVDSISGNIVFIDGEMYRIGETIGETGFVLESVDGLTCIIRTTDEHQIPFRLRYR